MIYIAHLIHPFTGRRKVLIVQSQQHIDISLFLNSVKRNDDIIGAVDAFHDVFNADYGEVVDTISLNDLREARVILQETAKEKRIRKELREKINKFLESHEQ